MLQASENLPGMPRMEQLNGGDIFDQVCCARSWAKERQSERFGTVGEGAPTLRRRILNNKVVLLIHLLLLP